MIADLKKEQHDQQREIAKSQQVLHLLRDEMEQKNWEVTQKDIELSQKYDILNALPVFFVLFDKIYLKLLKSSAVKHPN